MQRHALALAVAALFSATAFAADGKKPLTPQQQKMAECSSKAKGLKGEDFKKARDACLKGETTAAADKKELTPQQKKMADCNAKAKGLKGDEFKKTRDACLKA